VCYVTIIINSYKLYSSSTLVRLLKQGLPELKAFVIDQVMQFSLLVVMMLESISCAWKRAHSLWKSCWCGVVNWTM